MPNMVTHLCYMLASPCKKKGQATFHNNTACLCLIPANAQEFQKKKLFFRHFVKSHEHEWGTELEPASVNVLGTF